MSEKTHWKKFFNYDYLGTYSLPDGRDMILTIDRVSQDLVKGAKGKEQECFVCHFKENVKPMILNRTNSKTITAIYDTPFVEEWIGKKIQLFAKKVDAFGVMTDGLRIRDFIPKTETEADKLKAELRVLIKNYTDPDKDDVIAAVVAAGNDVKKLKAELKKLA